MPICDYSAESAKRRSTPAQVGERLVTHFISEHTIGFVDPKDPSTAVCMLPGTVVLAQVPEHLQHSFELPSVAEAKFDQVRLTDPYTHHDGLRFVQSSRFGFAYMKQLGAGMEVTVEAVPDETKKTPAPSTGAQVREFEPIAA